MSRVQALVPFPGLSRWRFASQLPEKGKGPSSSPPVGKRALSRVTPSATAQTCHALPWARVLSCPARSPRTKPRGKWVRTRVERRGRRRRGSFPLLPSVKVFSYWFVQGRTPQGREGVKLGALQDTPQWLCFLTCLGGFILTTPRPPIPVPQGLVVKWGTGASGPSLGRALPGPFVRQPRDEGPPDPGQA